MRSKRFFTCQLALALFLCLSAASICAQTTTFTYQGRLTDNSLAPNGSYNMQFALFPTPTGGSAIATQTIPAVVVANGIFTVTLDFGAAAFDGSDRYLEITVGSTMLAPRQQIRAVPYAIRALNATNLGGLSSGSFVLKAGDTMTGTLNLPANGLQVGGTQIATAGGFVGIGISPVYKLQVEETTPSVATIYARNSAIGNFVGTGVFGSSVNNPGYGIGGRFYGGGAGILASGEGGNRDAAVIGVDARATGTAGSRYGVWAVGTVSGPSSFGWGVLGQANGTAQENYGVNGQATGATTNYGIYGQASGGTTNWAGWFQGDVSVTSRMAVGGAFTAGDTVSVTSSSANPFAISAYSSFNGPAITGMIMPGNSTGFAGVNGEYLGTASNGSGVFGQTVVSSGYGVWGANSHSTGTGISATGNGSGGSNLASGSGLAATGLTTGVYARNTSSGISQAIYTDNFGDITRVNYYDGMTLFKINGAGTVSTVVKDEKKQERIMFAPEAPEVLFEDYGTGKLVGGRARIDLEPAFSANITVNERHPLRVFIQLEGDCNGVYVTAKSGTGFDVVELGGGLSNVSFSWHIVANRADEELSPVTQSDGTVTTRISHYADQRFPLQHEKLPTVAVPADPTKFSVKKPNEQPR